MQWVLGTPSPEVKQPGREADRSHQPTNVFKNEWNYTSTPHMLPWRAKGKRPIHAAQNHTFY
jgi:hypothetical protein